MPAPTFHGYGYDAWAGGPGSGFRHSWSQPHTANMHPGLTSVSQFGSTQSAGGVRRAGDSPHLASPGYGFQSSLTPPGWRGGSAGGAFAGFMGDVQKTMKDRQEAFQSAHSQPEVESEAPEGLRPPLAPPQGSNLASPGQVAAQALHTAKPVQPGRVQPTLNWTPSTTGAVAGVASRSRRKAFNPAQGSLF